MIKHSLLIKYIIALNFCNINKYIVQKKNINNKVRSKFVESSNKSDYPFKNIWKNDLKVKTIKKIIFKSNFKSFPKISSY